jgi:hypothetical protein
MAGRLHGRVVRQAASHAAAMAAYHPWGTADTPMVMPQFRVAYTPIGATFEEAHVIISANGAPIPGISNHAWGTVIPAGRP